MNTHMYSTCCTLAVHVHVDCGKITGMFMINIFVLFELNQLIGENTDVPIVKHVGTHQNMLEFPTVK